MVNHFFPEICGLLFKEFENEKKVVKVSGQQIYPPEPPSHRTVSLSPTFPKVVLPTNNQFSVKQGNPSQQSACKLCYTLGWRQKWSFPPHSTKFLINFSLIPPNSRFICLFKQFTHFPRVVHPQQDVDSQSPPSHTGGAWLLFYSLTYDLGKAPELVLPSFLFTFFPEVGFPGCQVQGVA